MRGLHSFPGANGKVPLTGGLSNRNVQSQSSGGWKSESKVSAGFVPSECCERESFLENILFFLLGCIRSYLWHTGSSLQLMDTLAVALGFG